MKHYILLLLFIFSFYCCSQDRWRGQSSESGIKPVHLTCEYLINPPVVDIDKPRLGWVNIPEQGIRGQMQTAWQVRVASSPDKLEDPDLWDSGKVEGNQSTRIQYEGAPLQSRQDCWWQVRVWDKDGNLSEWSDPAFWSMGLLVQDEWKAEWIGAPWQGETPLPRPRRPGRNYFYNPDSPSGDLPPPAPLLRKKFNVDKEVVSARAYVTGLGFFELYLNGEKVGEDLLVPNVTLYDKRDNLGDIGAMIKNNFREYRVMYLAYDLKDKLKIGENVVGAMLGNGIYNTGNFWKEGYGTPRFIGQIYLTYADGTEEIIVSDKSWKTAKGPVVMDLLYDGEHYDARKEQDGWCSPGFDDSGWEYAAIRKTPKGIMKAHMSPPDRVMEILPPVKIDRIDEGHYLIGFGEEITGWVHLNNISGEAGRTIEINYICESMMGDNTYTMKGGAPESYTPRFTWFVFSEVEIRNWPGVLTEDHIRAEAVYSDVETTGYFECSNQLFNDINQIFWRTQADAMHGGVVVASPHRERAPYNGDGQVACITHMHLFDVRSLYTKWFQDMLGSQNPENGYVPNCSPWQPGCGGGVAWGAAMIIMPWEFYLHYGDLDILEDNYQGMTGYIDYLLTWTDHEGILFSQAPDPENPNYWINLGDWVAPGGLPPDDLVHTFYLWRCADYTARAASALGKTTEAAKYNDLAKKTREAFHSRFFDNDKGSYGPNGGNIFALEMGVPSEQHERVTAALKADISANGGHLDTGIYGTQFFFEVLSKNGLHEIAFEAMNKRTFPSYGWWIENGATTMWEQWNGKGSRNQPMFGGGIIWLYRILAGMTADPEQPGYRHIIFRPQPVGDITYAKYHNATSYGDAGIHWEKNDDGFSMDVTVPVGCHATVYVPATENQKILESGEKISGSEFIRESGTENGYKIFKVTSGNYQFNTK